MARIPGPCPGFRIQVIVRYTMDSEMEFLFFDVSAIRKYVQIN